MAMRSLHHIDKRLTRGWCRTPRRSGRRRCRRRPAPPSAGSQYWHAHCIAPTGRPRWWCRKTGDGRVRGFPGGLPGGGAVFQQRHAIAFGGVCGAPGDRALASCPRYVGRNPARSQDLAAPHIGLQILKTGAGIISHFSAVPTRHGAPSGPVRAPPRQRSP